MTAMSFRSALDEIHAAGYAVAPEGAGIRTWPILPEPDENALSIVMGRVNGQQGALADYLRDLERPPPDPADGLARGMRVTTPRGLGAALAVWSARVEVWIDGDVELRPRKQTGEEIAAKKQPEIEPVDVSRWFSRGEIVPRPGAFPHDGKG